MGAHGITHAGHDTPSTSSIVASVMVRIVFPKLYVLSLLQNTFLPRSGGGFQEPEQGDLLDLKEALLGQDGMTFPSHVLQRDLSIFQVLRSRSSGSFFHFRLCLLPVFRMNINTKTLDMIKVKMSIIYTAKKKKNQMM